MKMMAMNFCTAGNMAAFAGYFFPAQTTNKLTAYSHGRYHLLNLKKKSLNICILSKIKTFSGNLLNKTKMTKMRDD